MMNKNKKRHKSNSLQLGRVFKTKILKIIVHAKAKSHDGRSCISNGDRCQGVQCNAVRENIDDQSQQKSRKHKNGTIPFNGIPVKEDYINHRVDETQKIEIIEYEHLCDDQQHKPENIYDG